MQNELSTKFLIAKSCLATAIKSDQLVNFKRFSLADFNKHRTEKTIDFEIYTSDFGEIIIASVEDSICYLHFIENDEEAILKFESFFPECNWKRTSTEIHRKILKFINTSQIDVPINLLVKGTDFQVEIWKGLTAIGYGQLTNYSELSLYLEKPGASRAVGSAIGMNEIAYLIPCHRVIQKTGKLSGFRWGIDLKQKLLQNELL